MSNRGGKRPGAGRPKGAKSKLTEKAIERAGATGELPLEFMLRVMRDEGEAFDVRFDAAKAAAPYMHARLASVEQRVTYTDDATELSREQLRNIATGSGAGVVAPRGGSQQLN